MIDRFLFRLASFRNVAVIGVFIRYVLLWMARKIGHINYRTTSTLSPLVLWLIVTTLGVWLAQHISPFNINERKWFQSGPFNISEKTWFQWGYQLLHPPLPTLSELLNAFPALLRWLWSLPYALLSGIWSLLYLLLSTAWNQLSLFLIWVRSQWTLILVLYTLVLLFWWVLKAGKRVVIEDFVDYTSDQPTALTKGLATLLVIRLGQLRDLYRAVDEQRAIPTSVSANRSIDASIKVEDVSEFLKDAVSAQSKFTLGPLEIPVGTLLSLFGRIVQGPRIIGSLQRDKGLLIMTAQKVGGKQSRSWRVDRPISTTETVQQGDESLNDMVAELAYQMFNDLALNGSVRWKATATFCEGLAAYRDCLRTPRDRIVNLELAEKKFIETLAEDQKFDRAYYNLGVVYTELNQTQAAEIAFTNAINQYPGSWDTYYALALSRFQTAKEAQQAKEKLEKDIEDITEVMEHEPDPQRHTQKKKDIDTIEHEIVRKKAFSKRRFESVVELCKRVNDLKPDTATKAKAYQLRGLAQDQLRDLTHRELCQRVIDLILNPKNNVRIEHLGVLMYGLPFYKNLRKYEELCQRITDLKSVTTTKKEIQDQLDKLSYQKLHKRVKKLKLKAATTANAHLEGEIQRLRTLAHDLLDNRKYAIRSRKKAIRTSWRALCQAELKGQDLAQPENTVIPQLETLASVCLATLAEVYRDRGLLYRAETLLRQALYLTRSDADYYAYYYFQLGETYYKGEKYAQAVQEYKHAIRIKQEKAEFWSSIGLAYAALKNEEGAKDACEKALATIASCDSREAFEEAFVKLAEIYSKLDWGSQTNAAQRMNEVKTFLEDEREINGLEQDMKRDELTEDEYERKLKAKLENSIYKKKIFKYALVCLKLGELYRNSDKSKEMKEHYTTAITQLKEKRKDYNPEDRDWEYGQISRVLGSLHLALKKPKDAEKYFKDAIDNLEKRYPQEIKLQELRRWFAASVFAQRDDEKNVKVLQETVQALAHDSLSHVERRVLGKVYFELKDYQQAINAWKETLLWRNALLRDPEDPDIHYNIGATYYSIVSDRREFIRRNMEFRNGISHLSQALELYDSHQQNARNVVHFALGYFHLELGEYEQAISHLKISHSQIHGPTRLTSSYFLGYTYVKNRQYDEGLKQFRSLLEDVEKEINKEKSASKPPFYKLLWDGVSRTSVVDLWHAISSASLLHMNSSKSVQKKPLHKLIWGIVAGTLRVRLKKVYKTVENVGKMSLGEVLAALQARSKKMYEVIESVGQMPLGEIRAAAYWGQAYIYAQRDVNLGEALVLIRRAQKYIDTLQEHKDTSGMVNVQFPEVYPDCEGWILFKLGRTDEAIACLERAVALKAEAEIYLHLALAYEQKLQQSKNKTQLVKQIRIHCQHAQELDIKKEYERQVNDLLSSLSLASL